MNVGEHDRHPAAVLLRSAVLLHPDSSEAPVKRKLGCFAAVDTIEKKENPVTRKRLSLTMRRSESRPRERRRNRRRAEEAPARWRGDIWRPGRQNNKEWDRRAAQRRRESSHVAGVSRETRNRASRRPTKDRTSTAATIPGLDNAAACRPRTTMRDGVSVRGIPTGIPGRNADCLVSNSRCTSALPIPRISAI